MNNKSNRPIGIIVIVIINLFAAILTITFWSLILKLLFLTNQNTIDKLSLGSTLGFLIADLIWAILLLLSAFGLWKLKFWGWVAAQMVNILWIYSMTVIWVRDLYSNMISPGTFIFSPFIVFSFWAIIYLFKVKDIFINNQEINK